MVYIDLEKYHLYGDDESSDYLIFSNGDGSNRVELYKGAATIRYVSTTNVAKVTFVKKGT